MDPTDPHASDPTNAATQDAIEMTSTAERYLPIEAQNAFGREIVRRLERIEDKLDRVASNPHAVP